MQKLSRYYLLFLSLPLLLMAAACVHQKNQNPPKGITSLKLRMLTDSLSDIASSYPGEIGVALILNNHDTIAINDKPIYPMMSVFKLHQAIALCYYFEQNDLSLDSIISIERSSLNPNTWSPMLKDYPENEISISVRELLKYTLTQSDNNASNVMFSKFSDIAYTDSLIAGIIPRNSFKIEFSEEDMSKDHSKSYANKTSPLGAAILINRLFSDSLLTPYSQQFIMQTLGECITGTDRIAAPLENKPRVTIAHKTGSGYINNEGKLIAHNDVAYIALPDSTTYSLAVFVKDFNGNESEASKPIARISEVVYSILTQDSIKN